jgi:galactonate dehydratase
LIIECIGDLSGGLSELLRTPLVWDQGRLVPPTAPGLGVELDEDVARAHPYTGDVTHLSMWSAPLDETDEHDRS